MADDKSTTKAESSAPASRPSPPASEEMEDQTPRTPGDMLVNQESRLNALRDSGPKRRKELVWLTYQGRKGSTGRVRPVADEHVDVIVPDEANEAAVEQYLDYVSPAAVLTPDVKKQLLDQGLSPQTIQMSGAHYHFGPGGPTPVDPDHAAWLLAHTGLAFEKVDAP